MNIKWSPQAVRDLASLRAFVAEDEPAVARRLVPRTVDAIETVLPEHPEIGRPGRAPGTRELVIPRTPYIVPYRVRHGTLQVLRVYHEARQWPDQL